MHRALQSSGKWGRWPDHLTRLLDEQRQATALANLQRYGEFRRITRVLGDLGIPVMALKGLHLAERA